MRRAVGYHVADPPPAADRQRERGDREPSREDAARGLVPESTGRVAADVSTIALGGRGWLMRQGRGVSGALVLCAPGAVVGREVAGGSALGGGGVDRWPVVGGRRRSEEHTSELQSLMRISYAVF